MKNYEDNNGKRIKNLDQKTLSVAHQLHPYVKNRIRVAEVMGIFPKNMYKTNELIDDVVLNIYENNNVDNDIDINHLRMLMFSKANSKFFELLESEKWHTKAISTKKILEEELALLEEKFTVDGGFDLIMDEELDDISYHQNDGESNLLQSDQVQQDVVDFLDLKDRAFLKDQQKQDVLRKMYRKLPLQTSNVVDLYILGKLDLQDIAIILDTEIVEVKRIIGFVKDNFKKHLI